MENHTCRVRFANWTLQFGFMDGRITLEWYRLDIKKDQRVSDVAIRSNRTSDSTMAKGDDWKRIEKWYI